MTLLVVCCVWAFIAGSDPAIPWTVLGVLLLVGTVLTFTERLVVFAIRQLP